MLELIFFCNDEKSPLHLLTDWSSKGHKKPSGKNNPN